MNFKSSVLKNRKAQGFDFPVTWIIYIITFGVILFSSFYITTGIIGGEILAESDARDLGVVLDVASLGTYDLDASIKCPRRSKYRIENNAITVKSFSVFRSGTATYYYMAPGDAILPDVEIDCTEYGKIVVEKEFDPDTRNVQIMVYGE